MFDGPLVATSASEADGVAYGSEPNAWVGYDVTTVGDTDGDGIPELLAGGTGFDAAIGAAFLLEGPPGDGAIDTAAIARISGDYNSEVAGSGVTGPGDLDGDGLDDVLVGAYYYRGASGRVALFHGPVSDTTMSAADTTFTDVTNATNFGYHTVATDLDGDGYTDLFFGAPSSSASGAGGAGAVYGLSGPFSAGTLTSADATVSILCDAFHAGAGLSFDLDDVDGDGSADLLLGGSGLPVFGSYDGGAWLFYGPLESGTTSTAHTTWTASEPGQFAGFAVDLDDLDGDGRAEALVGGYAASMWGRSMAGMGWMFWGE